MRRLTVARVVVATAGLFCGAFLALLAAGIVSPNWWAFLILPAFVIVLVYLTLIIRALRGYRLAAGIVAATAWVFALISWQWIVSLITRDPLAPLFPASGVTAATTLYALAATYVARRRGKAQSGAPTAPQP